MYTTYNILMCPSDKRPRGDVGWGPDYVQTVWAGGNTDGAFTRAWTSYSAGSMFWNNGSDRYGTLSLIKPGSAMFWDSWRVQSEWPGGMDACGYNLHKAGMNMGFADGHAKWYSLAPLKPLEKWGLYFWDPNADVVDANGIHNVGRNYLPLFNDPYAEPW